MKAGENEAIKKPGEGTLFSSPVRQSWYALEGRLKGSKIFFFDSKYIYNHSSLDKWRTMIVNPLPLDRVSVRN